MSNRRPYDAMGNVQAISNTEMMNWALLRGISLTPFEVETLDKLEDAYLRSSVK